MEHSDHQAPGPNVKFARFVNGRLDLFSARTTDIEYYAISHVWGNAEWLPVTSADGERLISKEKADFVQNHLPSLVGDKAFWMDTLTVNQKDGVEVLATVQVIPDIFRDAARTIAIRECDGIYSCCEKALQGFTTWQDFASRLLQHNEEHFNHAREESYVRRLWTLQECLLSHTIQFVVAPTNTPQAIDKAEKGDAYFHQNDVEMVIDCLWVLAFSFNPVKGRQGVMDFLRAYVNCGTISRTKQPKRTLDENIHNIENGSFRIVNLASNRCASMPRDYIFATMTQFPWYHYPADAANMTFSAIFTDLYKQASVAGHSFEPRILQAMTDPNASASEAWLPSKNQPEPTCLGDLLKLIGLTTPTLMDPYSGPKLPNHLHVTRPVAVREYENENSTIVLHIIESVMKFSVPVWEQAHKGGDLSKHGSFPREDWELNDFDAMRCGWQAKSYDKQVRIIHNGDESVLSIGRGMEYNEILEDIGDFLFDIISSMSPSSSEAYTPLLHQARKILDHMWCAVAPRRQDAGQQSDWKHFKRIMQGSWPQPLLRTMLLLAAMVSCGIGLSADEWVNKRFVPVYVRYKDEILLGLLAKHARLRDVSKSQALLSVGRQPSGVNCCKDLLLVHPKTKKPVGLLPDFLPDHAHDSRTDDLFSQRVKLLYDDLVTNHSPRSLKVQIIPLDDIRPQGGDDDDKQDSSCSIM